MMEWVKDMPQPFHICDTISLGIFTIYKHMDDGREKIWEGEVFEANIENIEKVVD